MVAQSPSARQQSPPPATAPAADTRAGPCGLPHAAPPAETPVTRIGVGIDTSRYGHYAVFLDDHLHTARMVLSPWGNDLVRRYLWMAALSAAQHNPATRALYQRVRAKHPDKPSLAMGHVMRKLLHLAFAVWKTGKPFDPRHYPWDVPAHVAAPAARGTATDVGAPRSAAQQAAGHIPEAEPAQPVVTAACPVTVAEEVPPEERLAERLAERVDRPPRPRASGTGSHGCQDATPRSCAPRGQSTELQKNVRQHGVGA